MRSATVRAPGTCGELVQGLIGGVLCHITCPVSVSSTVTVALDGEPGPVRSPDGRSKTAHAVERTLRYLNAEGAGALVSVSSDLPVGKGMASSTADVSAAIAATGLALGVPLTPEQVARLAVEVEPSDGTMFPGVALFDHLGGRVAEVMGQPPPLEALVLDFGGTVDTLEFNRLERGALLRELAPTVERAADLVRRGIADGDGAIIGQGATMSALAHQRVLYKPELPAVMEFARDVGAVGVNVAHSGVVIGVLLDGVRSARVSEETAGGLLHTARRAFPRAESVLLTRVIGGGLRAISQQASTAPARRA